MRKALYFVSIAGADVSTNFKTVVTSISVSDSAGDTAATASIELEDSNGQIVLPKIGAPVEIGLGWTVPTIVFSGVVDDVNSTGSRGGGRMLSISAKAADTVKGKGKEQMELHEDNQTLGSVMQKWGGKAGLSVKVHPALANIMRPYWSINNESFPAWGERMAKQLGATFKIDGKDAAFVPRSAGVSATGKPLVPITAAWGSNLISWSIKPLLGRPQHKKFRTRRYDIANAEWVHEEEDAGYDTEAEATMTSRYSEVDQDSSKRKSKSKERETDRARGGGSVDIDGEPNAQVEAPCIVTGTRAGVDGTYRIDSWSHSLDRRGGWKTSLQLVQPGSGTGKDSR